MPSELEEARKFVANRFSDDPGTDLNPRNEWWHQHNEETYQQLLDVLAGYMKPDIAVGVLQAAFWAAADEYGD